MKTTSYAALALVAALGLSACGSDSPDPASGAASTTSSSRSGSASDGVPAVGATVDGADLGNRMLGAMVKAGSGAMVIEFGTAGRATGSFELDDGTMRQRMVVPFQGAQVEIVSIDAVFYLKGLPGSTKPWVKIDPEAKDLSSQLFSEMLGDLAGPRQFADAMAGARATVVGSTGSETTYELTIDPSKLLGDRPGRGAPSSVAPVTARYVLDMQDRPVSMTVQVEGHEVSATFGDWGEPVTITAPPADQIGTFEVPLS